MAVLRVSLSSRVGFVVGEPLRVLTAEVTDRTKDMVSVETIVERASDVAQADGGIARDAHYGVEMTEATVTEVEARTTGAIMEDGADGLGVVVRVDGMMTEQIAARSSAPCR